MASYDGNMYSKRFMFNGNGETLKIHIRNYPSKMLTPAISYTVPYEFKIGIYHGDWMDAADIYKQWAKKQVWCQRGPLYKRQDLPDALYKVDLTMHAVYRTELSKPIQYDELKEDLFSLKEFFDKYAFPNEEPVHIGIHWVGWSKYLDVLSKNSRFPNYLPPQENFTELMNYLHEIGSFYNDVYLTALGFDKRNQEGLEYTWERDGRPYACYNPEGEVYTRFTSHHAWMDPSNPGWQGIVINIAKETLVQCQLDGEYFDWYPKYRLDFQQHEGGGDYYAKGYRELMLSLKEELRKVNPNFYFYPEGKSEIEIGVFDAMLMEWFYSDEVGIVHTFGNLGRPIPLISYLYHEYISMVGGIRLRNKDITAFRDIKDFRAVIAMLWVWGNKPHYPFLEGGRSQTYMFTKWKNGELDSDWVRNLEYLAELVKMYKVGKEALLYGEMVRPPAIYGVSKTDINLGGNIIKLSSVLSGAFKSPDGKIYIPLTNWGEKSETITQIDFEGCKWIHTPYRLSLLTVDGTEAIGTFTTKEIQVNIKITGREAVFLIVDFENNTP